MRYGDFRSGTKSLRRRAASRWWAGACASVVALAGCELGVDNPGRIDDEALDNPQAMEPLVTGMAGDFATVFDNIAYFMGIASGDVTHSGAFEEEEFMQRGEIIPRHVNGLWGQTQRARWVSEHGIERMKEVMGGEFASSPLSVEAYLWAGFSNRILGENVCVAVIDGGAPEDHKVHFQRAETWFTEAITLAQGQGDQAKTMLEAAYAGRAQVRLALEKWAEAAADAGRVSDKLSFVAQYSSAESREWNWLYNQSHRRDYFSAWNTLAHQLNNTDPRMRWTDRKRKGADGQTPMLRQDKYLSLGASVPIAEGDEMRLIEGEVALRLNNDVATAMAKINAVRRAAGVPEKTASTVDEAWAALRMERDIIFWMEGRHLWELRRFNDPFLQGRDSCIPPSEEEQQTNPNLRAG